MEKKSDSVRGEYEDYEHDTFYLELERQIVRLIDDVSADELKPCKTKETASSITKDSNVMSVEARLLHGRSYYDWSVCRSAVGTPVPAYLPAANVGTGVFIPQHHGANFEFRDYKK